MVGLCTKCETVCEFTENGSNYQCSNCNAALHRCKGENCNRMILHGPFCKKCVGRGLKKFRAGAVAVGGFMLTIGVSLLLKGNSKGK